MATGPTPLHKAVRDVDKLAQLIELELPGFLSKPEYLCRSDGSPGVLHCAVLAGNLDTTRLLLNAGADINEQDNQGRTALMQACSEGNDDLATFLVASGADTNVADHEGQNCAHYAYCMEHLELGNWLVASTDVDTSAVDADGRTPLDWRRMLEDDDDDASGMDARFGPAETKSEESKRSDGPEADTGDDDDADGLQESKLSSAKRESNAFIINGAETNFAAGTGLRAIKWLRKSDTAVICCDD